MIDVMSKIKIYEIGGKSNKGEPKEIIIHSHWNSNRLIDIELPGFDKITVVANDLVAAIKNATNTAKY